MNDNELIATFMGYNIIIINNIKMIEIGMAYIPLGNSDYKEFNYNGDCGALMEVVSKIKSIDKICILIYATHCLIVGDGSVISGAIGGTRFECLHRSIIDFIKWYNRQ